MSILPFDTPFAHSIYAEKYAHAGERWDDTTRRVTDHVIGALPERNLSGIKERLWGRMSQREFIPGGRYLYATGNDFHQTNNCLLLRCDDSREGWADIGWKIEMALLTGAGLGVYWGDVRGAGELVKRTGGIASGPVPKMIAENEKGRAAVSGGNRRCAIWAGLLWSHADIFDFINVKDWPDWLREQKAKDFETPAPMDMTNISVCLDDEFFEAYGDPAHPKHEHAQLVYWATIKRMLLDGEPGFSVDLGDQSDEKLRNACTEIVSADDSDVCNLGGLVLPRFDSPKEFGRAVRDGVLFLTAGTLYSDVPYDKVAEVREKNRRLGLDILGVHEFLLKHGVRYGTDNAFEVLDPYMAEYDRALEYAWDWQDRFGLSHSVAATSGAPTGTRGIIGETTTGWQTVTSKAYKRRVRHSAGGVNGNTVNYQYVVDPTVSRLVADGVDPAIIEDAFDLSWDYERMFKMQAYAQSHTDQAISMTVWTPEPTTDPADVKTFGDCLLEYLPKLRGITIYPNNSRAGQPITPVAIEEALGNEGVVFEEDEEKCVTGACGI